MKITLISILLFCTSAIAQVGIDEGIKCFGSSGCGFKHHRPHLVDLIRLVYHIPDNATFVDGQHAACVQNDDEYDSGLCVRSYNTRNNTIKGIQIKKLLEYLKWNMCKTCGYIPIAYPDSGDSHTAGVLIVDQVPKVQSALTTFYTRSSRKTGTTWPHPTLVNTKRPPTTLVKTERPATTTATTTQQPMTTPTSTQPPPSTSMTTQPPTTSCTTVSKLQP